MDSHLLSLCEITIAASLGESDRLRDALRRAARIRVNPRAVKEALLQVHLFAGFPASIEAFRILDEFSSLRGKSRSQVEKPDLNRGKSVLRTVYGDKYQSLIEGMRRLSFELAYWMIHDGYGKVLSRRGLRLKEREVLAVAALAALGWERQLKSHLYGCLNSGVSVRELKHTVAKIRGWIPPSKMRMFDRTASAVFFNETSKKT